MGRVYNICVLIRCNQWTYIISRNVARLTKQYWDSLKNQITKECWSFVNGTHFLAHNDRTQALYPPISTAHGKIRNVLKSTKQLLPVFNSLLCSSNLCQEQTSRIGQILSCKQHGLLQVLPWILFMIHKEIGIMKGFKVFGLYYLKS